MPGRLVTLCILLLWLATSYWFFVRDAWPQLRSSTPPPYAVDLVDETRVRDQANKAVRRIYWTVYRLVPGREEERYTLDTHVTYQEGADTFTLFAELKPLLGGNLKDLQSQYRITRRGDLISFEADAGVITFEPGRKELRAHFEGTRTDDQFVLHRFETSAGNPGRETTEGPVPLGPGAGFLVPLHPLNRLERLYPGRSWTVLLFDPIAATRSAGPLSMKPVQATVRPDSEVIALRPNDERPCLVVEYKGEGVEGNTWVQTTDGLVLRCKLRLGDETWLYQRGLDETTLRSLPLR